MPYIQFQMRRDNTATWASNNPILASGEIGLDTTTSQFKIGNGTIAWNGLPYGGLKGPTGPTGGTTFSGPTGSVLFSPDGTSVTGSSIMTFNPNTGYTGLPPGMLNITGNLKVSGGIDPVFLQLTATSSNPYPSGTGILWYNSLLNSLMVDNLALNGSNVGATGTTTTTLSPTTTTTLSPTTTTTTTVGPTGSGVRDYINVSTFAGGGTTGYVDATTSLARFSSPNGICITPTSLYVADAGNHRIRKMTYAGVVTTFAGSTVGNADGVGSAAQFNNPSSVVGDSGNNLYITDRDNHRIRKITPSGVVTTFAGSTQGYADGTGTAQFSNPEEITIDSSDNLYVCDFGNHRIRKITPAGVVTTIAGSTQGNADGQGSAAQFNFPSGIIIDSTGNLYVCDTGNYRIRKITPAGLVTTFAGSTVGNFNGQGVSARFGTLTGITIDSSGNFYVCDSSNFSIRKITSQGLVTTLCGSSSGNVDGLLTNSKFNALGGIARDATDNLFVSDTSNHSIRKITYDYTGVLGRYTYPTTTQYALYSISTAIRYGLAVDSDYIYNTINGSVIVRTSLYGVPGSNLGDSIIPATVGVAVNSTNVWFLGVDTHRIGVFNKSTLAFSMVFNNGVGFVDGDSATAKVNRPTGASCDSAGNIYFADTFNHAIRKITTSFNMTTIAGTNISGSIDSSNPLAARFNTPVDVFCNPAGTILYVADSNNHRIRRIDSSGVTTIGGNGTTGNLDGGVGSSTYNLPSGVCADNLGNVYVADTNNFLIRKIDSSLNSSSIVLLPSKPQAIRISSDYKYLIVACTGMFIVTL